MTQLMVGVTGHRNLVDETRLAEAVDAGLLEVERRDAGSIGTVVSALAEGADRLVARRALARPGWELVAVLPLEPDDYESDFATGESRAEFRSLLSMASEVVVVAAKPSRVDAYRAAGVAVLDRSDLLVALWDGAARRGRGGTADVVGTARERGLPVIWIPARNGPGSSLATDETTKMERMDRIPRGGASAS